MAGGGGAGGGGGALAWPMVLMAAHRTRGWASPKWATTLVTIAPRCGIICSSHPSPDWLIAMSAAWRCFQSADDTISSTHAFSTGSMISPPSAIEIRSSASSPTS